MNKIILILIFVLLKITSFGQVPTLLKEITHDFNSYPEEFTEFNGKVIFTAYCDTCAGESEVWITDGTTSGTKLLKNIGDKYEASNPGGYYLFKHKIYFRANSGGRSGLWVTDGTTAGTIKITDMVFAGITVGANIFFEYNDKLYFAAHAYDEPIPKGFELWLTDGTVSGTKMAKDIYSGPEGSYPSLFTIYKDKLYFKANDGIHMNEVWVSDGTESGTYMLKDICAEAFKASDPKNLFVFKDRLYFTAYEPLKGGEWWVSDGSNSGTKLFKDINPGVDGSYPTSNTFDVFIFENKFYFSADNGTNGYELWSSDGSEAGTVMIKDINPSGSSRPFYFCSYKNKFYFRADDGVNGKELWMSDGTYSGTNLFLDLNKGEDGLPAYLIVYDSLLYFTANNSDLPPPSYDFQLWVSDGDPGNTKAITPFGTNRKNPLGDFLIYTHKLYLCSNKLYFQANYDTLIGFEPYIVNTIPLSLDQIKKQNHNDIIIYPNPATQIITIQSIKKINSIRIIDITGKSVPLSDFKGQKTVEINLNTYTSGVYTIEINLEDMITRKQFIIQKP
ncbi:MAG: ELWxxDGT repeat protein [Chitinophagaceae bacterium]|jgi:ELWxxDGT repeat protein